MVRSRYLFVLLVIIASVALAQKKVLDASVYDSWKAVRNVALTGDGKWVVYALVPQDGDPIIEVKATDGSKSYAIERASGMVFSQDCKFLVATILPKNDETKKARRAKAKPEDMPKNGLTILNLDSGQRTDMDRVNSFSIAPHDSGWILYRPEPPKPAPKPDAPKAEAAGGVAAANAKPEPGKTEAPKPEPGKGQKKEGVKGDHKAGDLWVLRNLATGNEEKLENVTATRWTKDGMKLAYAISTPDGSGDGVAVFDVANGSKKSVVTGMGKYPKLAISDATKDIAFVTDKDDYQAKKPAMSLYVYRAGNGRLGRIESSALAKGFVPAETGGLQFSDKGLRLTFATAPKPVEDKKDETPDDEKVSVDVWNWQDPQMMPQQLLQAVTERGRTYEAAYDLNSGTVVQLETPHMRNVSIGAKGDGDTALGSSQEPYMKESSWGEGRTDYLSVDLQTGKASPLLTALAGTVTLSPTGKYVLAYDELAKDILCIDLKSGKRTGLNKGVSAPLYDEEIDTPSRPNGYGVGGWTAGDAGVLLYDKYDIWLLDPTGAGKPMNLTQGVGRASHLRFRLERLDPEAEFVDLGKPNLLSAFNEVTKQAGFYVLAKTGPAKVLMEDKGFPLLAKAKNANVYAFQKMDFNACPDVWLAGAGFASPRKVSDANPQQKDYNWCTAELVTWMSNDGQPLQGILYKPENFDGSKKYPMITYYYEKMSDGLHQYYPPAPSPSTINFSMYTSNGYVVFVPDIPYKIGYPGESAMSAILPGVQAIVARGYVDPKRLGLQGHSWGGYQTGFMVTETNMFAAACAGAPVADMISAYGGIRWESGISREGQYEHGQSRIGGSLWEEPLRFIQNSPIFFVDKIRTPLLIMSNDKDGAVPWYQGIEYFSALRRLNKPAWLVCYNEEAHNLVQRKNRKDWSIRMQQFFDHYLKGAPMPVWMAQGIPATMKGKTYGFDLVPGTDK